MPKRNSISVRNKRLECRKAVLWGFVRLALAALGLAVGYLVLAMSVPQQQRLAALETKLANAKEREREATSKKARAEIEFRALQEDQEFLETQARDRLDYYREGERVLRFRRD